MKKTIIIYLIGIILITFACEDEEILPVTESFTASDGTYIGIIQLAAEPVEGAEIYEFGRKDPESLEWSLFTWTEWNTHDDHGWTLPNNKIIPGQVYEYKVRTHANGPGFSEFSEIETGFAYHTPPLQFSQIKITTDPNNGDNNLVTLMWKDSLSADIRNLNRRNYTISYADENYLSNVNTLGYVESTSLSEKDFSTTVSIGKNHTSYYRLDALYEYGFTENYAGTFSSYTVEGTMIKEGDIPGGDSGLGTVTYTVNNYGEINLASTGAKYNVIMRADGTTPYVGYVDDYTFATGLPVIMANTGGGWNPVMSMPGSIVNDNDFREFDFEVSNGIIYLGALSVDSLYIYKYESGNWSENLADDSFGTTNLPHNIDIAILNNELYAVFDHQPDDMLMVLKYNGLSWQKAGPDITSFSEKFEPQIKNIDGTLYLWYNDGTGSTAGIILKHWTGSNWTDDFQWSHEYSGDYDLIKAGSELYFLSEAFSGTYFGGVYKITSSTTAVNLLEGESWFFDIYGFCADSDNNIIIAAMKWESMEVAYPTLYIYDGTSWSEIDDDNSDGMDHDYSTSVITVGNDLHFIYGLRSSANTYDYPTILEAKKYSK
ncbi:MAG: hypothetical protein KAU50_12500 [Candidatus Marinimicrobia bacterium]|nr:hypothetical protein [Candidatus Neomarinimicrobiota bacterium]